MAQHARLREPRRPSQVLGGGGSSLVFAGFH